MEACQRILAMILAQVLIVSDSAQKLLLFQTFHSCSKRARLNYRHVRQFICSHQVHLSNIVHLVFTLVRQLAFTIVLPVKELIC